MLPNFLLVGAPKAGTTSLYHYLYGHPQVFMSTPKEVNFFSGGEIDSQDLYYDYFKVSNLSDYEKLFDAVTNEKAIGEGSVSYLYYEDTPRKIKECLPEVKIIIILHKIQKLDCTPCYTFTLLALVLLTTKCIKNHDDG